MERTYFVRKKIRSNAIGKKAEELFKRALEELKAESRISQFERRDYHGVDFIVETVDLREVKVQVKSSWCWTIHHVFDYPDIPVVRVKCALDMSPRATRKTIQSTKRKILEILSHQDLPI